jgi:Cu/Ag efflux protein CusF
MNEHVARSTRRTRLNFILSLGLAAGIAATLGFAGCGSKPAAQQSAQPAEQQAPAGPKRYQLEGRVVSIQPSSNEVVVDHKDIPGFMMGMTMPYPVKNPNELKPLSPEDQIKADVVVNGNDVYLENIVVTKKADQAKAPGAPGTPPAPADSKKDAPKP